MRKLRQNIFPKPKTQYLAFVIGAGLLLTLFSPYFLQTGKMALESRPLNQAKESKLVQRLERLDGLRMTFGPADGSPFTGQIKTIACELRRKSTGGTFSVQFLINPDSSAGVLSLHSDEETKWSVPAEFSITEDDFSHAVLTGEIQDAVEDVAKIQEQSAKLELGVPYKKEQFQRYRYDSKAKAWR